MNTETDTLAPDLAQAEAAAQPPPMRDRRRDREQVARAVACCGAVARLYRRYGGAVSFVPVPASGSVKTDTPVKAPKRSYAIKRTLRWMR